MSTRPTCLIKAIKEYGKENVQAITFLYGQRHAIEIDKSRQIAEELNIKQTLLDIGLMKDITQNSLLDSKQTIGPTYEGPYPSTFVDGRNAMFILLAAIYAKSHGIHNIILGVCETDFSGYPDCRDVFIKSMNVSVNLAMDYHFNILTPLMYLSKKDVWKMADELGSVEFIKERTHTCYNGVEGGCNDCPSCLLRNKGYEEYIKEKL